MSSVIDLTIWREIRPYVVIDKYRRDGGSLKNCRHRIEIRELPEGLRRRALAATMPCVACGQEIHPFRERHAPTKRGHGGAIYFAACCSLATNVGCSRGVAARDEYIRVADACAAALF